MFKTLDKQMILSDFPNIKLSYENIIYKKVYNADMNVAIPEGIKCFAWFTTLNNNNCCFIMELTDKKQIKDIINIQLSGNTKVRILDRLQQNIYVKAKPGQKKVRVQDETYNYLKADKAAYLKTLVKPKQK